MLLVWCGFLAGGVWLLRRGNDWGWVAAVLGGIGAFLSAMTLLPGGAYLRLTSEGFTVGGMLKSFSVRWNDARGFGVVQVSAGGKRAVGYQFADTAADVAQGALPDTYGLTHEDLADLLNEWQRYHGDRLPPI